MRQRLTAARLYSASAETTLLINAYKKSDFDAQTYQEVNVRFEVWIRYTGKVLYDPASQEYWKTYTWYQELDGVAHKIRTNRDLVNSVSSTLDYFIQMYLLVNADACR